MSVPTALPSLADASDAVLVDAVRRRDEAAFSALVSRHSALMVRAARGYLGRRESAEDVVQDTWIAVLRSIDLFEGRSSFKTWLMRILVNTARRRGMQESRTVCWSSACGDAERWDALLRDEAATTPEHRVLTGEVSSMLRVALDALPPRQRSVLVLRDVEGWTSDEVQDALGISPGNQRVLLYRARARLRARLGHLSQESEFARAGDRLCA
jgi:RNA polymerase sigma-70 factor (ECF subfamily)